MFATQKAAELGYNCINCLLALLPVCAAHTGTGSNSSKNRESTEYKYETVDVMINMVEEIRENKHRWAFLF